MTALIYEDDAKVGELTREAFERTGSRLLQIHRFAETDEEHAEILLNIFEPPYGSTIADVGCGVGRLAELIWKLRPDLSFTLINKSKEQLDMCAGFDRILGTAESLPIKSVDAIMATYVLGHVDLEKFVSECVRVNAKQIYVYDLFVRDPRGDCRLRSDLQYSERTIYDTIYHFAVDGFKITKQVMATYVPESISGIMPSPETLNNTVSAALVFEK